MTKFIVIVIFIVSGFVCTKSFAQQLSDPAKEEAVKLTGDYYWEEATARTIDEAKNFAREFLLKRILVDYNAKVNINQIKTIQVDGIDYLLYIRGPKYRLIAFIEKKNVTELLETLKEMQSVEVNYSDKYPDDINDISEQIQEDTTITNEVYNQQIDEAVSDSSLSQVIVDVSPDALNEQNSKIDNKQELAYDYAGEKGKSSTIEEIRREFSVIKDANELSQIINQYKLQGMLVFGRKEAFNNPDKCDIIIINPKTEEVLIYLLQKDNKFIDYTTNQSITDYSSTFNGMTEIWIQFF